MKICVGNKVRIVRSATGYFDGASATVNAIHGEDRGDKIALYELTTADGFNILVLADMLEVIS